MDSEQQDGSGGRIATALNKLGLASRHLAWSGSQRLGLTPTQGQILAFLRVQRGPQRLLDVSAALGTSAATISDAVKTLVEKELVVKRPSVDDRRAVAIELTAAGHAIAGEATGWTELMLMAVDDLDTAEQAVLLRGLIKLIRVLQIRGEIPVARMCVSCAYFRPNVHVAPPRHHCAFVDAPFGDAQLRPDCGDYVPADPDFAKELWESFITGT